MNFLNYTSELENEANEFGAELMKYQEEVSFEIARDCDLIAGVRRNEKICEILAYL